jgi:hypothetical protein
MTSPAQLDAQNIRRQLWTRTKIKERIALCELLLELYPSRRNKKFVNDFIKKYGGQQRYGLLYQLKLKINAEKIVAHREKILANRRAKELAKKTGAPLGATLKVMGSDGKMHWSDGVNDLGIVEETSA